MNAKPQKNVETIEVQEISTYDPRVSLQAKGI